MSYARSRHADKEALQGAGDGSWAEALLGFGYPSPIIELVEDVRNALDLNGLVSLLLVGSGGRGELRYTTTVAGVQLLSDLEFFAFVRPGFPATNCLWRVHETVAQWRKANPTFHIDISFLDARKRRFPNNLDLVEARSESILVAGKDYRERLPREPNAKQVIAGTFAQLWELLHRIDANQPSASLGEFETRYALARTSLHLLTLTLVLEGVNLPKIKDKVRYFVENYRDLRASKYFGAEYVVYFQAGLAEVTTGEVERSPVDVYRALLDGFDRVVAYSCETLGLGLVASYEPLPKGLLQRTPFRRMLYEAWVAAERTRQWGAVRAVAWALRPWRQIRNCEYLLALNRLVLAEAAGDIQSADRWRARVHTLVHYVWPAPVEINLHGEDYKQIYYRYLISAYPWYARRYRDGDDNERNGA